MTSTATPAPTASPTPQPTSEATLGADANLRAEPNPQAAVLAVLRAGTRVTDLGRQEAGGNLLWRQVRTEDGRVGWVASDLLSPAPR